jgi:hypothetical protein
MPSVTLAETNIYGQRSDYCRRARGGPQQREQVQQMARGDRPWISLCAAEKAHAQFARDQLRSA